MNRVTATPVYIYCQTPQLTDEGSALPLGDRKVFFKDYGLNLPKASPTTRHEGNAAETTHLTKTFAEPLSLERFNPSTRASAI